MRLVVISRRPTHRRPEVGVLDQLLQPVGEKDIVILGHDEPGIAFDDSRTQFSTLECPPCEANARDRDYQSAIISSTAYDGRMSTGTVSANRSSAPCISGEMVPYSSMKAPAPSKSPVASNNT